MRKRTALEIIGIVAILSALGLYIINQDFSPLYVPPPTTTISTFPCDNTQVIQKSNESEMCFAITGTQVNLTLSLPMSITINGCSYSMIHVKTPVSCGTMCGGGIGYTDYYSDTLKTNFTINGALSNNLNATLAVTGNLTVFFQHISNEVFVNAQQVDWNGYPPSCESGGPSGTTVYYGLDCLTSSTSRMLFELPSDTESIQLLVNSSVTYVP